VVDEERRHRIEANHSATHLLHEALREVLGSHVEQKGSFVSDEVLRFDFAHFAKVEPEQLRAVERIVAARIRACIPLQEYREVPIDEAREMGAMALFGEKYGDHVRVIRFGSSTEFCGGTHVASTGVIGTLRITSESSVAAGVRRIEAVTSKEAFDLLSHHENLLKQLAAEVKAIQLDTVVERVATLGQELKEANGEIAKLKAKIMKAEVADVFNNVEEVNGTSFITVSLENKEMDELRQLADTWRQKGASDIFVVGTASSDKANLLVAVSKDANAKGLKAGDIIKAIAPAIQGGGGGRPDMAQAGGKNPAGIPQAFELLKEYLAK